MESSANPRILITGATGSVGSEIVKNFQNRNIPFRVLVRPSGKTTSIEGGEIVFGDLNDEVSVLNALQGIEKAFLLTNSSEVAETLQTKFADLARQAGTEHIVKLSQFAASQNSPVRFLRYHAAVEQRIIDSGLSYTFLRPNLYMQGLLGFHESIAKQGTFFASAGEAKVSAIDIRDIADVATEVLCNKGHENKIYTLTGPEALSHAQMAGYLSEALGKAVNFVDVRPGNMYAELVNAGFPVWQAEGLIEDYAHYARGEASEVTTSVKDITGRPARDFKTFASDYSSFFRGS